MKNTLRFSLIIIGVAVIGYGIYTLLFPQSPIDNGNANLKIAHDSSQSLAMIAFGALSLISGLAFRRK